MLFAQSVIGTAHEDTRFFVSIGCVCTSPKFYLQWRPLLFRKDDSNDACSC